MRSVVCKQKSEPKKERMSHPARYSRTDIRSRQPRLDGDRDDGGQIRPCAIGLGKGRASARGRGRTPEERPDLGIAKRKPPRQTKRECGGACVNLTEEADWSTFNFDTFESTVHSRPAPYYLPGSALHHRDPAISFPHHGP